MWSRSDQCSLINFHSLIDLENKAAESIHFLHIPYIIVCIFKTFSQFIDNLILTQNCLHQMNIPGIMYLIKKKLAKGHSILTVLSCSKHCREAFCISPLPNFETYLFSFSSPSFFSLHGKYTV